jgi:ribosomal RNA-processing protein 9
MEDDFFVEERKGKRHLSDETYDGYDEDEDLEFKSEDEYDQKIDLYANESAAEKRIRLAKEYLDSVKRDVGEGDIDAEEIDRDIIADRLLDNALESQGKLFRRICDKYRWEDISKASVKRLKQHDLSITAVVISEKHNFIFSASKDCSIIKYDLLSGKKLFRFPGVRKGLSGVENKGHSDQITCLAISSDGKYLASGGIDKLIHIWDAVNNTHLKCFTQHRKAVLGLAFRNGNNQMYSCSLDRTIKVWNIEELSYIETLFGHRDGIAFIDSLNKERCVSVGLRDRTLRLWKIVEETQLILTANASQGGSLDVVRMIDEDSFLTGSSQGCLSLWNVNKKRPAFFRDGCHTSNNIGIQSITSVRYTDLFVTGAGDSLIKFWRLSKENGFTGFEKICEYEMEGCINSMAITGNGKHLVVGVGREPRLGRWAVNKTVKNAVYVISLCDIMTE